MSPSSCGVSDSSQSDASVCLFRLDGPVVTSDARCFVCVDCYWTAAVRFLARRMMFGALLASPETFSVAGQPSPPLFSILIKLFCNSFSIVPSVSLDYTVKYQSGSLCRCHSMVCLCRCQCAFGVGSCLRPSFLNFLGAAAGAPAELLAAAAGSNTSPA